MFGQRRIFDKYAEGKKQLHTQECAVCVQVCRAGCDRIKSILLFTSLLSFSLIRVRSIDQNVKMKKIKCDVDRAALCILRRRSTHNEISNDEAEWKRSEIKREQE